ncbi:MAG: alpha-ketoacid dehydrogenase subunit beta, partial [Deltaproteobacteria bacterium]|nr:alpha-ketoacid dehydrogenase subunit beta [Deltaproteobacteria bacterium]
MRMSYGEAIRNALATEMRLDDRVYIFGEDVAHYGGVFGITKGLLEEFGEKRVRNTPLSEAAILGEAIGAAVRGLRPVPEIQFADFLTTAFSQVVDFMANYHYRFHTPLPIVIRAPHGGGMRIGN